MQRGLSPTHLHVVAVEGDVDGAELDLVLAELRDQPAQALSERHTARLDADERDPVEIRVPLDDLVRDAREGALDRFTVEKDLFGGDAGRAHVRGFGLAGTGRCIRLLSGLTGPGLKGFGSGGTLAARPDDSHNAAVGRLGIVGLVALAVAVVTAGIAHAALWLNFSRASAEPGEIVYVRTAGTGALAGARKRPVRVFLAPVAVAAQIRSTRDGRLVPLGRLRVDRKGTGRLRFVTPAVRPGYYKTLMHCPDCARYSNGRTLFQSGPSQPFRVKRVDATG